MMSPNSAGPFFPEVPQGFSLERLRWIVKLRWGAMATTVAAGVAMRMTGFVPSVAWQGLVVVGLGGLLYNVAVWRKLRNPVRTTRAQALWQASADQFLLTLVLWVSGGIESPFLFFYVFHVALIGIVGGPRSAWFAGAVSVGCVFLLGATHGIPWLHVSRWDPVAPWGLVAHLGAFFATVGGIALIVAHAVGELRKRDDALRRARREAVLEYQLLTTTLNELGAGLEVLDERGAVLWRNRRAEEISRGSVGDAWSCRQPASCPGMEEVDGVSRCPAMLAAEDGNPGRCRLPVQIRDQERIYDLLSFPLTGEEDELRDQTDSAPDRVLPQPTRVMNLYVDQTKAALDDQRLVLTERLVSLGRVAQGVAHELNTPLATIRTLATDMRAVLSDQQANGDAKGNHNESGPSVEDDLLESTLLIQDETRRLGRITQALLAGGDLVRSEVQGEVSLRAVVERARALVFAGVDDGPDMELHPSLTRISVNADPDRLVQVLVNLLQNARDAVRNEPHGKVSIVPQAEGDRVVLAIEDNGPGLSEAVQDRLFEPFVTDKPLGQGTGLGLYTSFMLARTMGGNLTIENRPERGVCAAIELPLSSSDG